MIGVIKNDWAGVTLPYVCCLVTLLDVGVFTAFFGTVWGITWFFNRQGKGSLLSSLPSTMMPTPK